MNNANKIEVLKHLSPEMLEVLRYQDEHAKDAFNTVGLSYPEIRANYVQERRFWNEGGPEMHETVDVSVPCEGSQVLTRIFYPTARRPNACIFYLHGGGFTVGSVETHDRIMRILAHASGCIVVGVDYSLSPEAKFPKAVLECAQVCAYYRENAARYGINPGKLGFAGDSGGANLSMGAYLWLRDHSEDSSYVKGLLLYYGGYSLSDSKTMRLYGGPWGGLTEEDLDFYMDMYFARPEDRQSPYYNFYNNDLTRRMPACFIASCEFDPLRDDSETLYAILSEKGIPCLYKMYPGTIHAFLHYSRMMKAAEEAIVEGGLYFKGLL